MRPLRPAATRGLLLSIDRLQREELAEMLALAKEFIAIGVDFERPIINYECMWQLP